MTKRLLGNVKILRFATVFIKWLLGRRETCAFRYSFGRPRARDERVVSLSPAEPTRAKKKRKQFKTFRRAAFLSSHPQQPFSAAILSSLLNINVPSAISQLDIWRHHLAVVRGCWSAISQLLNTLDLPPSLLEWAQLPPTKKHAKIRIGL